MVVVDGGWFCWNWMCARLSASAWAQGGNPGFVGTRALSFNRRALVPIGGDAWVPG